MVAQSNKRKVYYVWGIAAMLIIAGVVTTAVVMIEKNRNAGGPTGSSNAGRAGIDGANGSNLNPADPSSSTSSAISASKSSSASPTSTISADPSKTTASSGAAPTGGACSNPRVRKSWKELTDAERSAFLNAILAMKKAPSINGNPSRYEDFVIVHDNARTIAHATAMFLPWHRHFVIDFENELRKIDPSVTVPYWDWALDSQNPASSTVFSNSAFGGNGDAATGCVTTGVFANTQLTYPKSHCLQRFFNGPSNSITPWSAPEHVAALLINNQNYASFRKQFEEVPHAYIHSGVGGDMSQMYSPNDPLFWIHHSNVDRYFYIWQTEHPNSPYSGSNAEVMAPFGVPVSIGMQLPGTTADYCYTYSASVSPLPANKMSLRRRTESTNPEQLKYPAPIPESYTLTMGGDPKSVAATVAKFRNLTDNLNQAGYVSPAQKVNQYRKTQTPVHWVPVQDDVWRFSAGHDRRKTVLDAWNL